MLNFENKDGHLNLEDALIEIEFLYRTYGLEDDNNLTKDAQKLKQEILEFVHKIKSFD